MKILKQLSIIALVYYAASTLAGNPDDLIWMRPEKRAEATEWNTPNNLLMVHQAPNLSYLFKSRQDFATQADFQRWTSLYGFMSSAAIATFLILNGKSADVDRSVILKAIEDNRFMDTNDPNTRTIYIDVDKHIQQGKNVLLND